MIRTLTDSTDSAPDLTYDEFTAAVAAHLRQDALLHPENGLYNASDEPKPTIGMPDASPAQTIVLRPLG